MNPIVVGMRCCTRVYSFKNDEVYSQVPEAVKRRELSDQSVLEGGLVCRVNSPQPESATLGAAVADGQDLLQTRSDQIRAS